MTEPARRNVEDISPFLPALANVAAERALLGVMLLDNRALDSVADFLRPEHFSDEAHGRIFDAIATVIEKGQVADPTTLAPFLEADAKLSALGGAGYLGALLAEAVAPGNAAHYGRAIHDFHLRRGVVAVSRDSIDRVCGDVAVDAIDHIERTEQQLFDLATSGTASEGLAPFKGAVIGFIDQATVAHRRDGGVVGVGTGFRDVDDLLGGLQPEDLVILAGRPSMGKTALATNIAYNAASLYAATAGAEGAVVGFFSLEMSAEQLAGRILAEQSGINAHRIRKGQLSEAEFGRLATTSQALHGLPIFIDDAASLTVAALRARARRMKRKHGLGLIVVDFLQLMEEPGRPQNDGRVQEVSAITRGLKRTAKELHVPVLALSQLSRKVEDRTGNRPQLSDLRESGSIEQDADIVGFIFREEYYLRKAKPGRRVDEDETDFDRRVEKWEERVRGVENLAELIIDKHRHGPVGTVELAFHGDFTRFGDFDAKHGRAGQ